MKPLSEYMSFYAAYHRDLKNRLTHFFGVPAIAFAILIPMSWARIELGSVYLSLAMAFTFAVFVMYFLLDILLAIALMAFFAPLLVMAEWLGTMPTQIGWLVFAVFFVGGWVFQLVGHIFEGRRPALVDNFFQVLIAPIFLMAEVAFALGMRQALRNRVEELIPNHLPKIGSDIRAKTG